MHNINESIETIGSIIDELSIDEKRLPSLENSI